MSVFSDLRRASLTSGERAAYVWDDVAFSLAMDCEIGAICRERIDGATVKTIFGLPVHLDSRLPDGVVEFRAPDGRLVGRVVNIGMNRNEMG